MNAVNDYRNSRDFDPPVTLTPPKEHFLTVVNFRQYTRYTDGFAGSIYVIIRNLTLIGLTATSFGEISPGQIPLRN